MKVLVSVLTLFFAFPVYARVKTFGPGLPCDREVVAWMNAYPEITYDPFEGFKPIRRHTRLIGFGGTKRRPLAIVAMKDRDTHIAVLILVKLLADALPQCVPYHGVVLKN